MKAELLRPALESGFGGALKASARIRLNLDIYWNPDIGKIFSFEAVAKWGGIFRLRGGGGKCHLRKVEDLGNLRAI